MFPGGVQFYNEQKIKGSILLSGAVLSSLVHLDFANKYKNWPACKFWNWATIRKASKTHQELPAPLLGESQQSNS